MVSAEPATEPGMAFVRVARGATADALAGGTSFGPYPTDAIAEPFELALEQLRSEGFEEFAPGSSLIEALESPDPSVRARAAARIGWRRDRRALEPLLEKAREAIAAKRGEACAMVEALGRLGDARAIPLARELAERKNLSRRRSGGEALRLLGDKEGLAQARQRGFERLPPAVQQALGALDETIERSADVKALVAATQTCDPRRWGLVADVLYEAGTPVTVAAARRILAAAPVGRPHSWRYAKSVLKRAMLRRDAKTFGFLAHAIESEALQSKGSLASVKSGWDGKKKHMRVFGRATSSYVRRACWRFLRDLAKWEPQRYAQTAAELLVHYHTGNGAIPKGLVGTYGRCYLLMWVLHGGSVAYGAGHASDKGAGAKGASPPARFRVRSQSLVFTFRGHAQTKQPPGAREEAYPELWDAGREAYVRVLSGAKLPEVFAFGLAGLQRHPDVLKQVKLRQLLKLLRAREELAAGTDLTKIVVQELERRFDPMRPDFGVLATLLESPASEKELVRTMLTRWLGVLKNQWARDEAWVHRYLRARDASLRVVVARCLIEVLGTDPALRATLAPSILEVLRGPEAAPGALAGYARVAREALLSELGEALDLGALLLWLDEGSVSGKGVAGALLGAREDGLEALGMERVVLMAEDEVAAVRQAAHGLLRSALPQLREDPSLLFALAESDWTDTRDVAFGLLKDEIDFVALGLDGLGLDGLIGLCDSTDPDVESLGRELLVRHFGALDAEKVLFRLAEHPSRAMRRFALGLMGDHLRDGFVPLARLEGFFRAVLFDAWPSRALKYGTLEFLMRRGLRDQRQAQLVAELLAQLLRSNTSGDFDRVVHIIAILQVRFPKVKTDLVLAGAAP